MNTNESAEATISEYRHKLNKFALRRLAQKHLRSKRQGLLPGSLLTTPGRRRPPRSSRHPRCSSNRQWCRLDPGLQHLVAQIRRVIDDVVEHSGIVSRHGVASLQRCWNGLGEELAGANRRRCPSSQGGHRWRGRRRRGVRLELVADDDVVDGGEAGGQGPRARG